jgi:opacity protein-like surface antigen
VHAVRWTTAALAAAALAACAHSAPVAQPTATADTSFAAMQERGRVAMGVDQYSSSHIFEPLPDGGRIVLQRDAPDTAGTGTIRAHLASIAAAFSEGNFDLPGFVHGETVPGAVVMAARRNDITYTTDTLPRGGEVMIQTSDSTAVAAVHEFLAYQRHAHHAMAHDDSTMHKP